MFNSPEPLSLPSVNAEEERFRISTSLTPLIIPGSKNEYSNRRITVAKEYGGHIPRVMVVTDQLKQVLLNLLNNAADACHGGGVITVSTEMPVENIAGYGKMVRVSTRNIFLISLCRFSRPSPS